MSDSSGELEFSETLHWPIWLWFFLLFLAASLSFAVWAALGVRAAIFISVIQFGLLLLAYFTSGLKIGLKAGWLQVGKAKIEIEFISTVCTLDSEQMRKARGPQLDPAAYLALRFWVSTGIKIELNDPRDPTPYWLISTKAAEKLQLALDRPNS
jgi:hypothetical protein